MFTFTLFRIVLAQAPHTTSPPAHFILISFVVDDLVRLFWFWLNLVVVLSPLVLP